MIRVAQQCRDRITEEGEWTLGFLFNRYIRCIWWVWVTLGIEAVIFGNNLHHMIWWPNVWAPHFCNSRSVQSRLLHAAGTTKIGCCLYLYMSIAPHVRVGSAGQPCFHWGSSRRIITWAARSESWTPVTPSSERAMSRKCPWCGSLGQHQQVCMHICVWSCCVKTPHNFCKRYRTSLCSFFACGICALNKWGRNMFLGVLEVLRHVVNMVWPPPCGRVYSDRNVNLKPKRYLLTVVYTYVIFAYKSYPKIATHLWCLIS